MLNKKSLIVDMNYESILANSNQQDISDLFYHHFRFEHFKEVKPVTN